MNRDNKESERASIIYGPLNALIYSGGAAIGEGLQRLAEWKLINYSMLTGQLSDFSTSAAFASLLYGSTRFLNNKFLRASLPLVVPITWSMIELLNLSGTTSANFDIKDIYAYWLGAGVGIATTKITAHLAEKHIYLRLEDRANSGAIK